MVGKRCDKEATAILVMSNLKSRGVPSLLTLLVNCNRNIKRRECTFAHMRIPLPTLSLVRSCNLGDIEWVGGVRHMVTDMAMVLPWEQSKIQIY
jgi:hypothetical protein